MCYLGHKNAQLLRADRNTLDRDSTTMVYYAHTRGGYMKIDRTERNVLSYSDSGRSDMSQTK
jgi:hypothetical protein